MKCKGCDLSSVGVLHDGRAVNYCIGSPDFGTPDEYKHLINHDRVHALEGIYEVKDDDECVLYHSKRFEPASESEGE